MIRKAVGGLVIIGFVILAILLLLGFRPSDFREFLAKPYLEALKDGDYLGGLKVLIDGQTVEKELSFTMKVRNPTPRELSLEGAWSEEPESYSIGPSSTVSLRLPPRGKEDIKYTLTVHKPQRVFEFRSPVFQGQWTWEKFSLQGGTPQKVTVKVERPLEIGRSFGTANYVVLFSYFIAMLAIGWWASGRIKTTRGFFVAEGKMHYMVVGLSILGTYLSALTMMGLSGMAYGVHDWTYVVQLPCLVITAMVITGFVLPRYREAGIVSIYQYLEMRIDVSARLVAAVCFLIFSVARMGLVLYLPALAFSTVTGTPLEVAIVGIGVVITVYTVIGGIEAVIWTDAIQVVVIALGSVLTLGFIFRDLGVDNFLAVAVEHNKFRVVVPEFDIYKITTMWLILETLFQTVRIYGTQQDIAQRFMATESTEKANRSVWLAILAYIPLGFLFYFIGTALFAFYKVHPDVNLPAKADAIFPHFIVNHLPVGIAGLIMPAVFAAAMSSIDTLMNSSSTVCIEDFAKRFGKTQKTDAEYLRQARWLTVLWGILAIVMALLLIRIQYAQIVWGKVMGITTNGILGLMALAFLPFRISKWAALAGFVVAYAALFAMMCAGINFLLWPVVGNSLCFFVALFLHPLYAGRDSAVRNGAA